MILWKPEIMTIEETFKYIIDHQCSIARFGDGEIALMYGRSISFQKKSDRLRKELGSIYSKPQKNLLICIPGIFARKEIYTDEVQSWWRKNLRFNWILWKHKAIRGDYVYGDALCTRPYRAYRDRTQAEYRFKLFSMVVNGRNLVIIEGNETRLGMGNDLLSSAVSIERILCPGNNAFDVIDAIEQYVVSYISKDSLLLIALGPTATVLAARLSIKGYQALDIGHIDIEYEWFRRGVSEKVAIPNKFTNEAKNGNVVSGFVSDEYEKQIIADFAEGI